MPRLDRLSEIQRNMLLTRPVEINDSSPFVVPERPLSECSLTIVTTAGLHLGSDQPFLRDDPTYRAIPASVVEGDLLQSHTSLAFDRAAQTQDLNVVFPIERVRELVARGEVGELAPSCFSFMGAQSNVTKIKTETAPALADRLKSLNIDVVLLTPT